MLFSMILAVLYEGLKSLREYLMCVGLRSSWNQARKTKSSGRDFDDDQPLMNDTLLNQKHRYFM